VPRFELHREAIPDRPGVNPFTKAPITIQGRPERREIVEIEVRTSALEVLTWRTGKAPRVERVRFARPEQAQVSFAARVAAVRRRGFREAGPSQLLAPERAHGAGSTLLLDELFAAGDARFLDEVLACASERKLAALAEAWAGDARPEMRRALVAYVDDGCDRPHHRPLVKRLFKHAEKARDDELMAHFLVAFDRLTRRFVVRRGERTTLAADPTEPARLPSPKAEALRFSRATRRYLARRAFRYFRVIGKADPARYGKAARAALALYEDRHLDAPERLLDAWGLLHVLYAWSPVLDRDPRGVRVAKGRSLADLEPAPYWPQAWRGVHGELLDLVAAARSRTVRRWAIAWLENDCASELVGLPVARLRPLLGSAHDEVCAFGARLLGRARGLEALPVDEWLALLAVDNLEAVPAIVEAFETHVAPKRLSLAQCAELATARVAVVAELGLRWARERAIAAAADVGQIARIAQAPVAAVRAAGAAWLLQLLEAGASGGADKLRDLFDSRFADVRALAIAYAGGGQRRELGLPLWLALLESPYDDVRALVVERAEAWQAEVGAGEIEQLAATVVLAVHRGAATKQTMLRRIADRAAERPEEAHRLLPVLALALRSVRGPERIGALVALARGAVASEPLREALGRYFPEIAIDARVSA
jgi:hypothetical protein